MVNRDIGQVDVFVKCLKLALVYRTDVFFKEKIYKNTSARFPHILFIIISTLAFSFLELI